MKHRYFKNPLLNLADALAPVYSWLPIAVAGLSIPLAYWASRPLTSLLTHHEVTLAIDAQVPLVPFFITFYIFAYAQWVFTYIAMANDEKKNLYNFCTWSAIGKWICLAFFIFYPTYMTRPEIVGTGVFNLFTRAIYALDTPDNLFPSIHCLESWLCFRAFAASKRYPKALKIGMLCMTVGVCASTVLVHQHVLLDIPGGILTAELAVWLTGKCRLTRIFDRWDRFIESHRPNKIDEEITTV